MKGIMIGLGAFVVLLAAVVLWMAGGVQSPRIFEGPVTQLTGVAVPKEGGAPESVRVVVWNIAWGYGWGSEGSGEAKPKDHFDASVQQMGETLRKLKADVVLLQEVDFDATRSHRQDQAQLIAEIAGLPYIAPAVSWTANWVPFPYWPPKEHFGSMSSGGAVLSRFPLKSNRVELLAKPQATPWWYNLFYLFRYVQTVEVVLPQATLTLFNTHLEAFHEVNRMAQAEHLHEVVSGCKTQFCVLGGDFNSVPPESTQKHDYADDPATDNREDETLVTLRSIPSVRDTIPAEVFRENPAAYFTFPAHEPNRKLDYLLAGPGFEIAEARVVHEAGPVSDHLPVMAELRVGNNAKATQ